VPQHSWKFKSHFRREAYSWKSTSLASKRMREAVSEIKKVAKKDKSLAGEGVIELFVRLYPALMQIDSSSGALGRAMNKTIDALQPILIEAEWEMNTRGKHLEILFEAIQNEGWGIFDNLRDHWGEICVYEGLAHLWADRLIPIVRQVLSSRDYSQFSGTDMCLSCLVYTGRYEELNELLKLYDMPFWFHKKFWALALLKQGKLKEALSYATHIKSLQKVDSSDYEIDEFCESVLIEMGNIEEAYQTYGLKVPFYGTYLNIFRGICKKYPTIDKRKILLDCIEKTGSKGKWFATAKTFGFLDLALECAQTSTSDPNTLLRATRDFSEKNPEFAIKVGIEAIMVFLTGNFLEPIAPIDVYAAYSQVAQVAEKSEMIDWFRAELSKRVLKESITIKPGLRDAIMSRLKVEG